MRTLYIIQKTIFEGKEFWNKKDIIYQKDLQTYLDSFVGISRANQINGEDRNFGIELNVTPSDRRGWNLGVREN